MQFITIIILHFFFLSTGFVYSVLKREKLCEFDLENTKKCDFVFKREIYSNSVCRTDMNIFQQNNGDINVTHIRYTHMHKLPKTFTYYPHGQ